MEISDEVNRGRVGSKYWVNCEHDSFSEITNKNFQLPHQWAHSRVINETAYASSVLKPVNGYAMHFYNKPELMLEAKTAVLRYKTHAEIWVEQMQGGLYALDKVWQRQFYPSHLRQDIPDQCFDALYKFYVPWIIDKDATFKIREIDDSPFKIISDSVKFKKLDDSLVWDVDWIHFAIKDNGKYLEEYQGDIYGVIKVGSNICDVIIDDELLVEELIKEYDK